MAEASTPNPAPTAQGNGAPAAGPEHSDYDVIVAGGGPAGSTVATLVSMAGHRVLQLERESFPRFKVGESLIPATYDVLDRLGVVETLRDSHFPKKYSVQFFNRRGKAGSPFYFHETDPSERSQTWQVLRSEFDQMLFDNGRQHGVETHDGCTVKEVLFAGERAVGVQARFADGQVRELRSKVVVDATGQRALLARHLGIRKQDPDLRQAAIYTHYDGGQRGEGIDEGATLILHTEAKKSWFWFIPMPDGRVSVGVVGPVDYLFQGRQGDPQKVFDEELARCPGVQPRLEGATQSMDVRVINDFSYVAQQAGGDGWVLAGDAFGFLDPMYSTGVLLALRSGEMAADAVNEGLAKGDLSGQQLGSFQGRLQDGMAAFRRLIYAFYDERFSFGRFLEQHPEHRQNIIRILVGDVFDVDFTNLFADLDGLLEPAALGEEALATSQGLSATAGA